MSFSLRVACRCKQRAVGFKRLEAAGGNQSAEVLLIELKQKMGVLPAGTQINSRVLGSGRKDEEAIEVEEIRDEKK